MTAVPPKDSILELWRVHSHEVDSWTFQEVVVLRIEPLACCLIIFIPQLTLYRVLYQDKQSCTYN